MTSPAPALTRTDVCPACGSPLPGSTCPRCALELVGPTAVRLLEASRQADRWLGERVRLVQVLRDEATARRARWVTPAPPVAQPVAVPPVTATKPVTATPAQQGWAPPVAPQPPARPSRRPVLSVQSLLVGLGALLLAVASVVFLAFSWDRLGITGRSVVVATLTVTVLGAALLARRARMALTAEAVGAFGAVLVLLDAVAVRVTGLAGEGMGRLSYAAAAALVCAAVMAGVARLGRLRSLGVTAAALLPLAPALVGGHLALRAELPDALSWLAAGLLVAATAGLVAGPLAARGARAEACVLTWAGGPAAACAGLILLVVGPWVPWQGALLATGGAVLGLLHAVVPGGRARGAWSAVAGASAAVAVALAAVHLLDTWALLGAPMGVGLVALALRQLASAHRSSGGPDLRVGARAALTVLAVAAAPAAFVVALHPVTVLAGALRPWSAQLAAPWADAVGVAAGDWVPGTERTASFVAVLAVAGVLAGWWRVGGALLARRAAALVLGVLVVCLPWQLDLSVLHVVATALLLAVGAAAAGHALRRRPDWVVEGTTQLVAGAAAGALGVVAAWTVEPLSVPMTLVGVAGLVLARRTSGWAVLDVPATAATLVAVGGVVAWAGRPLADAALVATLAGLAAFALASLVPVVPQGDRRAAGGTGAAAVVLALVPALAVVPALREPRLLAVLATATALVALLAADPRRVWSRAERALGAGALVPFGALTAATGVHLAGNEGVRGLVGVDPVLAAAVVVAAALASAATLHRGRRVLAPVVELSGGLVGGAVLLAALAGLAGARDEAAWPLLVVLAVGAAALATVPSRRWVAWVALALASGALWDRLAAAEVGSVEAFSVPPALVLLLAGVVTTRRDGVVARPSTVTGLVLLVLPSAVASVGGPWVRPAVLLAGAAAAALVAHHALGGAGEGRSRRRDAATLLLGAAAVAVLAGPAVRASVGTQVEVWSLPSAVVLAGVAVVLSRPEWVGSGAVGLAPWTGLVALVVGTAPSLAVGTGEGALPLARHLGVVVLAGAVLVVRSRGDRPGPLGWGATAVLALAAVLGATGGLDGPVELITLPAAGALALAGASTMRRSPALGSWPWIGPAATAALVPSLVLATTAGPVARTALLTVGAAVVLVEGVRRRWQAPVLVAATVLAVHAVVQLSPFVALAYQAVPRWASLALVGLVLLALGARYEARVRDVVSLRRRVATLR